MSFTLSILDQSLVGENEDAETGIQHTVRLAEAADQLGYHRFWVSEHHNNPQVAGSSPEALAGYLLAKTTNIRIGSGGVMLQHYSPFKVAETFHVLASLAPGRVDLGVGKAPGGLNLSTQALQEDYQASRKDFSQKLVDLKTYLTEHTNELNAQPIPRLSPDIFLLGGSIESAEFAAKLGISFVFAFFINGDEALLKEARETFQRYQKAGTRQQFLLAITVSVADDPEQALSHIKQKETVKVSFSDGRKLNVTSLEDAEKLVKGTEKEHYSIHVQKTGYTAGTKETVHHRLTELAESYDINEFIVLSPIVDIDERITSITLLKKALDQEQTNQKPINQEVNV
ncbi:LLM class flavin-dependent oxidoreductase [Bacillus safensis]|uniref:LLM class flavin-dependent oxidoreductase n=1 Tax=Bacillus safensis TaxID=561879 RepID=UPI00115C9DF4|nr:LLM class flavin-dependent oxidoreductase [Bacillus sp. SDF0016]TQR23922.1 LLM class flavin-dependent oxidoreductase [Bacillus sp. SDF0016]